MAKHIHADLITKYAELSHETDRPWEHFEVWMSGLHEWINVKETFYFDSRLKYRLKPRTIKIGNYDVPEPERDYLKDGVDYYIPAISCISGSAYVLIWRYRENDLEWLRRGLVHLTQEAAELHAKALIALTSK